ncbi:MAG: bifunctional UDP-N-acetylmuramoyl-tripeptide:D-alanyl-D-alanine ligase/alanine racemase [Bacteroidota bacterium]|jgi:alanine racemase|nr:bifunctional UDP-N-acetylmuramoyl-tripeptide:D-alanyl-D-alanine ligase/alanine racemase [Bacteroidota bacterium]
MKLTYSIANINEIINGTISGNNASNIIIKDLLIDSRKIITAESSLFFAIKGERNDGHIFIADLYEKGVRSFVVSELPANIASYKDAAFLKVKNTLFALQLLCAHHRDSFDIPVIGITGSNGKTIVKEWLFQLLREDKNVVRSPKSFNSQVGVPLSVWQINEEHDLAIFEAGISKHGEMGLLQQIIQPTIGLITNIGQAHDENFQDQKHKITEKLKLFDHADLLVYCKDYLMIHNEITNSNHFPDLEVFTWSRKSRADLLVGRITKRESETEIQAVYKNNFIHINIPFTDEASIENAIHCWALMLYLEYENNVIAERMKFLSPVAMRLELKEGINNCSIINDSYNSDLGSLSIALDFLNQQKQHPKKTLILSDILQSGKNEEALYKEVAELIHRKGITRLIGIGEAITRQSHLFQTDKIFYNSTTDFLQNYNSVFFRDETILLKGARAFGFEAISKVIQQKAHETILEINLNAIVHNLNYYRSKIKADTKVMAMVKAFSYGSGSFEIANILQFHRVDYLAVAYADEGIELRKAGITVPIMVMNPEEQSYDSMIQYNLEPEIYSFRVLNLFEETLKRSQRNLNKQIAIHIKLDTGMHRLGFEPDDVNELIVRIKNNKQLLVKSVFSHLVATDEAEHDAFTWQQIKKFTEMSDEIQSHLDQPFLKHILNSAGITRFPDAQFDMVRLGIGLYGIGASSTEQSQLQNVSTLKTSISQIKHIPANETIGYSRKGLTTRDTVIATVPIGYADGLSRKLSNGKGKMMVKGKPAPIIGNVCMDMCMIDITDIRATENDEVIVFGEAYPIAEVAKDVGTIPYEVLTNVSRRVKRVYYQE